MRKTKLIISLWRYFYAGNYYYNILRAYFIGTAINRLCCLIVINNFKSNNERNNIYAARVLRAAARQLKQNAKFQIIFGQNI